MNEHDTEEDTPDAKNIDFWLYDEQKLCDGQYHIVFAHPESFISSKYGQDLLLSQKYAENQVAMWLMKLRDRAMVILNNISLVAFHSKCTFDVKKTQHKYTNIIKYQIFSFINEASTSLLCDITLTY